MAIRIYGWLFYNPQNQNSMRLLLLFMWPVIGYSQLDTTLVYKEKEAHAIAYMNDSVTLSWKIDTIKYQVPFDIRFTKTKVYIDGYGTYSITKHELHGINERNPGYHYYELSNGTKLTWIEKWVYWEWPIVKRKTKMVIFVIK